ncbi:hypothetical protein BJ912DRAFT_1059774 [Pholiota molesta]|nr:hypothetical protein BJ912DRAFT_1059774 [Pholiota molesta]
MPHTPYNHNFQYSNDFYDGFPVEGICSPTLSDLELETLGHYLGEIPRPSANAATIPTHGASVNLDAHHPPSTSSTDVEDPYSAFLASHNATPLFPMPPIVPSQSNNILSAPPTYPTPHHNDYEPLAWSSPPRNTTPPPTTLKRDYSDIVSPESAPAPKPKVKKTAKKARDSSDDEADDAAPAQFELVVHVYKPLKLATTSAGRRKPPTKPVKAEPTSLGPAASNTDVSWKKFLRVLAELLETTPSFLAIHSFQWKFLKPGNSPWLPLASEIAYQSLIRQLREPPKNVSGSYIVVKMDAPVQQPVDRSKPWTLDSQNQTRQPSNLFGRAAEDEDDTELEDNRKGKKAAFDEDVSEHISALEEKYAAGNCQTHPNVECFHHRPTDHHFELTRARKIFWAVKIRDSKASLLVPPLSSNLFKANTAMKTPKTPAHVGPPAPPVTPTPTHPMMTAYPYTPQPYGYPPPIPYPNYLYPPPPGFYGAPGPSNVNHHTHRQRSSDPSPPRSSPPLAGGSIEEFCEQYGLKDSSRSLNGKTLGFLH